MTEYKTKTNTYGNKYYFLNGKLHRENGQAIKYINGTQYWYFSDKKYGKNNDFTNESWKRFIKTLIFS